MTFTPPTARGRRLLDLVERLLVIGLYGALVARFVASLDAHPFNLLFLIGEGLVVAMLVLRRGTDQISVQPIDWVVGLLGAVLPMLIHPSEGDGWSGGVVLMLAGLSLSVAAKLTLGRRFGVVAANRGVKRDGLYGAVRHPMYLGYLVTNLGMLMLNPSLWNLVVLGFWMAFQIARIGAEERLLLRDPAYRAHVLVVRRRLVPFVY